MSMNAVGLPDTVLNTSFVGLVLSLAGWVLLQAWLLAVQASPHGHALMAAAGLGLVILAIRPSPLYQRSAADPAGVAPDPRRVRSGAVLPSALFLFAMGGLIGISAWAGSTFVLLAAAVCLSFFPWRRLSLCRQHFLTACSIVWAGAALTVLIGRDAVSLMFLPLAGWVFWMCAGIALLLRARTSRKPASVVT